MSRLVRWYRADVVVVWAQAGQFVGAAIGTLAKQPSLAVVVLAGEGDTLIEARVVGGPSDSWAKALIELVRQGAHRAAIPDGDREN
jgi:hypothetical protein